MGLTFFNPAELLPSPEVAVKPPPPNNTGSFIISEALKETNKLVKDKRDVDSLKAEANAYADYVQESSPELATLLRNKANGYRLGMDTNEERSGFLKGVIGLSRLEQQDKKTQLLAEKNDKFNNTGAILSNTRGLLDTYTRRELEWNQQEQKAFDASEARRKAISATGANPGPRYVMRPNPYTDKVNELSKKLESTVAGTESYPSKSGYSAPTDSAGGGLFPNYEQQPTVGGTADAIVADSGMPEGSKGEPISPLVLEPPPSADGPAIVPNDPQLTEPPKSRTYKLDPTGVNPPEEVTKSPVKIADQPPALASAEDANDPAIIAMHQARAAKEAVRGSALRDVQSSFENLDSQKEAVKDKTQLTRIAKLKESAEKEIKELDILNPNFTTLSKAIVSRFEDSVRSVMTMSIAQLNKKENEEGDQSAIYETIGANGIPGVRVPLKERRVGNEIRVFKVEPDGSTLTDVTDEVKKGNLTKVGPSQNPGGAKEPPKTIKQLFGL